ncbi:four-carbon acid sugar kinase family protein [Novosphingobium rosa]|uniref:four-carbon acid sugar kinase family protein n=1 Tax=Novosphingobium rosa TaxID=76978 RepID=UPI00082E52A0|nr:four-carbon acid sugar kinase family protein [Novosphingobium rosa]
MSGLRYAWYGDDFTGSTDVLEALASAGFQAVLFLRPPGAEELARFGRLDAVGLAGDSRSRSPDWMNTNLDRHFAALEALGPELVHYKTCSTFDSAPQVGSIGRAMEIGHARFGGTVPIVVGQPNLRRYVAFGTLFAAAGEAVQRLDRHPTMAHHPVTPMAEADLRRHLAAQTDMAVALVSLEDFARGDAGAVFDAANAAAVLFDSVDQRMLEETGHVIAARAGGAIRFGVGSGGLTRALVAAWGGEAPVTPKPRAVDRLLVVSGSCSPATAAQIGWAKAAGWTALRIDVARLHDPVELARLAAAATAALGRGESVVIHSAQGDVAAAAGAVSDALGPMLGNLVQAIVPEAGIGRVLFAGGDTSSHAVAQLGGDALTWVGPLAPGAPLCRLHAADPAIDGLELVLKGGQMGAADFFETVRKGG